MEPIETGFDAGLIGLALFSWRQERGEIQDDVADGTGLPQTTIGKMEAGESLRTKNLGLVCGYFDKTMADLDAKVREIRTWPRAAIVASLAARRGAKRRENASPSHLRKTRGRAAADSTDRRRRRPRGSTT